MCTGHETTDVAGVLDGDLSGFMSAFLRMKGQEATQQNLAAPVGASAGIR